MDKGSFNHQGKRWESVQKSQIKTEPVASVRPDVAHESEHERLAEFFVREMREKMNLPEPIINLQMQVDTLTNQLRNLQLKWGELNNLEPSLAGETEKQKTKEAKKDLAQKIAKTLHKKMEKTSTLLDLIKDNKTLKDQLRRFETKHNERRILTTLRQSDIIDGIYKDQN